MLFRSLLGDWSANTLDFSSVSFVGGNFLLDGAEGNDTIKGTSLADRITGGGGMDVLSGGGGSDTFICTNLNHCLWSGGSTFESITDFVIGVDQLDVNVVPQSVTTLGSTTALTNTAISNLLNSTAFTANAVASFSYNSSEATRTFLAINDGNAGFNKCTDALVEITGYSFAAGYTSLNQMTLV